MAETPAIEVTCPGCKAGYLLPANLIGPGGARIQCPNCGRAFEVPAGSGLAAAAAEPASAAQPAAPAPSPAPPAAAVKHESAGIVVTPLEIARALLAALAEREGSEIERSVLEGNLFARFGPAIFEAYDQYRRRAREGGPQPFRAALQERWGVELPEITPRP